MITVFDMASGQEEVAELKRATEVPATPVLPSRQELQLRLLTVDEALVAERRHQPG